MLEANQFICLLLAVSILRTKDIYGALQRRAHANRSIDVKDRIIEIQCYAKCFKSSPENCQECERKCRIDMTKAPRPGKCPSIITSNHISACIDACQYDFDCSETQKCCRSTCGPVCHDAVGLDKDLSLPPIPKIIAYQLPKGKRVCEVKIQASANSVYAYHVEARHHVGSLFSARKLGSWQWQAVERIAEFNANKTRITGISFKVKPGRWYEFRVAAINANGFRGYTESSKPFTLSNQNIRADPKPPRKPQSLQVLSSKMVDGLMSIRVAWCSPKSDLPIEKYRLIWALYVQSDDDSLIAKEIFVKDANQFEITRLVPDSCYYIQVQAISINGRRRLKSEKISLLFNTTTTTLVQNGKLQCSNHKTSKDVSTSAAGSNMLDDRATNPIKTTSKFVVNFRSSKKFVLIVQISGFYPQKGRLIEICAGDFNCENPEYGAIRPKKDFIEFDKLKFNTTYTIRAIDPSGNGKGSENDVNSSIKQFTTPTCEVMRTRHPKIHIDC